MSFNRELYYDLYDAMLGITKEQADAKEEATRKSLKERELKFRKDSQDPQVRYNYNLQMQEEEQSPKMMMN